MERLTAAEARRIAGPTVDEWVELALDAIKKASENKNRSVALHDDFWVHGGYGDKPEWKAACKQLVGLGYTVEFFYEERQFVDMYTIVKW